MKKNLLLIALAFTASCTDAPSEKVNIITGTYADPVIQAPQNCPDFSKPSGADWNNTLNSNYGCATVTNFGAMAANPNDLVAGKSSNLYNGARTAVSVGTYETGPSAAPAPTSASSQ